MSSQTRKAAGPAPAATRETLLNAAGEVFAERGFRNATVREICQRAGANVAAVNYHFRDKEGLYSEVLSQAMSDANRRYPFAGGLPPEAPPEQRLGAFVRNFLGLIFDNAEHAWLGRLIAKEMIEPTHALELVVAERIRPMATQLRGLLREIAGGKCDDETLRLCGLSVVSQCVFYNHCSSVVSRLYPQQRLTPKTVERLVEHITRFSLAALTQLARGTAGSRA
jgi:AcrR family transcriptional regulator